MVEQEIGGQRRQGDEQGAELVARRLVDQGPAMQGQAMAEAAQPGFADVMQEEQEADEDEDGEHQPKQEPDL